MTSSVKGRVPLFLDLSLIYVLLTKERKVVLSIHCNLFLVLKRNRVVATVSLSSLEDN